MTSRASEQKLTGTICDPLLLFENHLEFDECRDTFNCERPAYLINGSLPKATEITSSSPDPSLYNLAKEERQAPKPSSLFDLNPAEPVDQIQNDLLNLNLSNRSAGSGTTKTSVGNDLFGDDLFERNATASHMDLLNDIIGSGPASAGSDSGIGNSSHLETNQSSHIDLLEELFSSGQPASQPLPDLANGKSPPNPLLANNPGAASQPKMPRNTSTPNLLGFDPFDPLGSVGGGSGQTTNGARTSPTAQSELLKPQKAPAFGGKPTAQAHPTASAAASAGMPRVSSCSAFGAGQPNYSRSFFTESKPGPTGGACNGGTGIGSKVAGNAFQDLLGGFTKTQSDWSAPQPTKSMGQLRKEELVSSGLRTLNCSCGIVFLI